MVKLKKKLHQIKHFVLFITVFGFFIGCSSPYSVQRIEGKQLEVQQEKNISQELEDYISYYRKALTKEMDSVLAFNPISLDKSKGQWQTNIGDFLADISFEAGAKILKDKTGKNLSFCILNHGGIRSVIAKGNVTTRNAFEVMPFENNLIIVELKGEDVAELASYFVTEKKPHPLSGLTLVLNSDTKIEKILVQGNELEWDQKYYVATSDYLSNGGDNMLFFKKATQTIETDYKIRNIIIDYFKKNDTLQFSNALRVILK